MPNTLSAKRSVRVIRRRAVLNKHRLGQVKEAVRRARKGKLTAELSSSLQSILDKAARHRVISKNKAARLKSRLLKVSAHEKKR